MKEQTKNKTKIMAYILVVVAILSSILVGSKFMSSISLGVDTQKMKVEANLEKYLNYSLSNQEKGTLVQYQVKQTMEYGENYSPIKSSEIQLQLSQIDGKYPNEVKAITKTTKLTNGKENGMEENWEYDAKSGILTVKASNQNEEGRANHQEKPGKGVADEYIVICYYDTYVEENQERDLKVEISAKAILEADEEITIHSQETIESKVSENIGNLTSIHHETNPIYNGYIKANQINGSNYNTQYKEKTEILISKKEAQETLEIIEKNTFIQQEGESQIDLDNNQNLVYKNTKINKEDLEKILGKEAKLEILDKDQNILATIDNNTPWEEDGSYLVNYETEPEEIIVKTSSIQNEGILKLEHNKEIKSNMKETKNIKIKTTDEIVGIQEDVQTQIIDIEEATTNVSLEISNQEWTNKQQNEITFNISLNATSSKDNMFKNPKIKIELPQEVEKVILQNSGIFHENGLALKEVLTQSNEKGNTEIIAILEGTQEAYSENILALSTDIKISATIILKKDINIAESEIKLVSTNEYTLDGSVETQEQTIPLIIESYQEEKIQNKEDDIAYNIAQENKVNEDSLKLEVATIKGASNLKEQDSIYAGEYIKYNIKVTNTKAETLENVKIVGNIPEETIYGELEAQYYTASGKYEYHFDEELKQKEIQIGTLKPGESKTVYYEVKAKDVESEKEITSHISAYVEESEIAKYELKNTIKPAKLKMFLGASLGNDKNQWYYTFLAESAENKEIEIALKAPKEFELNYIVKKEEGKKLNLEEITKIAEDNTITIKVQTNKEYIIGGYINKLATTEENEKSQIEFTTVASAVLDGITYQSNENRILYGYENASITMTSETEGEEIKYDEEINYNILIENTGKVNLSDPLNASIHVNLADFLPENVKPVSVTYHNWIQEEIKQENGGEIVTDKFSKTEEITEEIYEATKDGEKLPDINLYLTIPKGESINIQVKTKAGVVYEKTKIENSATISGEKIKEKTSNVITNTILPYNYEEPSENPDNPDNPGNPEDPSDPTTPGEEKPEETYSIKGLAWLDENEDGQRQTGEKTLSGITAMLIDSKEGKIVKGPEQTKEDGTYQFNELKQGDYIVLFQYDTNQYRTTEYQKNGVPAGANSDAVTKKVTLNGESMNVGMIEVSDLESSVTNMDIGLIENKICDFKLDKYVSKITVTTKEGTKQYGYQNEKLAKVEIRAKEIEGATVVIEYKIVVSNEGELASTVGKVIDYLPEGLTFSSELNANWSAGASGQLINTSIANQKIEPGESKELTLIATKKMTANNEGTFTNAAEIGDISNSLGIKDRDSTPANKVKTEDDYSEAEVIISVSTGIAMYVSIGILLIVVVGVGIFLGSHYGIVKIGKMSLFGVILVAVILSGIIKAEAAVNYRESANFTWYEVDPTGGAYTDANGSRYFRGDLGVATCQQSGVKTVSGSFTASLGSSSLSSFDRLVKRDDISFQMTKLNDDVPMKTVGNDCIFGPFEFNCSYDGGYKVEVLDGSGSQVGFTVCDSSGNSKTLSGTGNLSFYVKIPASSCKNGISKVSVSTKRTGYEHRVAGKKGQIYYVNDSDGQDVKTESVFITEEEPYKKPISNEKIIEWTNLRGAIEIIKQDNDNANKKLAGVKITISSGSDSYTLTTDENGRAYQDNLPANRTYQIVEIENPNYGYRAEAKGSTSLKGGQILTYTLKNIKHTGNLLIEKKDQETGKPLAGMSFKIKDASGRYIRVIDTSNKLQTKVTGTVYVGKLEYTTNEAEATEFITDSNGKIQVFNLLEGNYTVIETSVGNNYYGYEVDDDYITWTANGKTGKGRNVQVTITRQKSYDTEPGGSTTAGDKVVVYNERKYIKLSGYVWVDQVDGKTTQRNNLFGESSSTLPDTKDLLLNGIEVRLKNRTNGAIVKHDKTGQDMTKITDKLNLYKEAPNNGNGEYQFIDVLRRKIGDYYIEFEYDGLTYTNVIPNINKDRGSKASEEEKEREKFNENFAIVEGKTRDTGITKDSSGAEKNALTYKIDEANHEATLISQGKYENVNGEYMKQVNIGNYKIIATTDAASYSIKDHYVPGQEEIRYINLGLYQREQPDIALVKDIQNVRLSVNGYEHTYTYNQRFVNAGEYGGEGFNVGVKFGSKYGNMTYTRPVYKSDYDYINEAQKDDKELKAYITYKLVMKNQASNLKVQVNEIVDYYDQKYELVGVGTSLDEKGNVAGELPKNQTGYNSKYAKLTIDNRNNSKIEAQKEQTIYVQFKLSREQVAMILKDKQEGEKADTENLLYNIAEINSYSVFDQNDKRYAGIDLDSNPGNATPDQENTYEDDTDKAPALQLEVTDARKLAGKVFEDETVAEEGQDASKVMKAKVRRRKRSL